MAGYNSTFVGVNIRRGTPQPSPEAPPFSPLTPALNTYASLSLGDIEDSNLPPSERSHHYAALNAAIEQLQHVSATALSRYDPLQQHGQQLPLMVGKLHRVTTSKAVAGERHEESYPAVGSYHPGRQGSTLESNEMNSEGDRNSSISSSDIEAASSQQLQRRHQLEQSNKSSAPTCRRSSRIQAKSEAPPPPPPEVSVPKARTQASTTRPASRRNTPRNPASSKSRAPAKKASSSRRNTPTNPPKAARRNTTPRTNTLLPVLPRAGSTTLPAIPSRPQTRRRHPLSASHTHGAAHPHLRGPLNSHIRTADELNTEFAIGTLMRLGDTIKPRLSQVRGWSAFSTSSSSASFSTTFSGAGELPLFDGPDVLSREGAVVGTDAGTGAGDRSGGDEGGYPTPTPSTFHIPAKRRAPEVSGISAGIPAPEVPARTARNESRGNVPQPLISALSTRMARKRSPAPWELQNGGIRDNERQERKRIVWSRPTAEVAACGFRPVGRVANREDLERGGDVGDRATVANDIDPVVGEEEDEDVEVEDGDGAWDSEGLEEGNDEDEDQEMVDDGVEGEG